MQNNDCPQCRSYRQMIERATRDNDQERRQVLNALLRSHLRDEHSVIEADDCKPASGLAAQLWPGAKVSR